MSNIQQSRNNQNKQRQGGAPSHQQQMWVFSTCPHDIEG
jgi:hypothetical protein